MGGPRGSDGVVSGATDLGDLRGHTGSMNWVCATLGGHSWAANPAQRSGWTPCEVIRLTWAVPEVDSSACEPLRVQ
jgi:hypothetical protein